MRINEWLGAAQRMERFSQGRLVVMMVAALFVSACTSTDEGERRAAAEQAFNSSPHDSVVVVSVEMAREFPPPERGKIELVKLRDLLPEGSPWQTPFQLNFVKLGSNEKSVASEVHTVTHMPIYSLVYSTSHGYRHEEDNAYYFVFKVPHGRYALGYISYFIRNESFSLGKQPEQAPSTLVFQAEKGKVNYAGNLKMRWLPEKPTIFTVYELSSDIDKARTIIEAEFRDIEGEVVDAIVPGSHIGTNRRIRSMPITIPIVTPK